MVFVFDGVNDCGSWRPSTDADGERRPPDEGIRLDAVC